MTPARAAHAARVLAWGRLARVVTKVRTGGRRAAVYEYEGERGTLAEWAGRLGVTRQWLWRARYVAAQHREERS